MELSELCTKLRFDHLPTQLDALCEQAAKHELNYREFLGEALGAEWQGRRVPEVLLSGHHAAVAAWRQAEAERITRERRPDLWVARQADCQSGDSPLRNSDRRTKSDEHHPAL